MAGAGPNGTLPYSNNDTSQEAAISMLPTVGTQRQQVYDVIREGIEGHGATCDEIELVLGTRHSSTSARIWEMNYLFHVIKDSQVRRPTRSGRKAIVWELTDVDSIIAFLE